MSSFEGNHASREKRLVMKKKAKYSRDIDRLILSLYSFIHTKLREASEHPPTERKNLINNQRLNFNSRSFGTVQFKSGHRKSKRNFFF